MTSCPWHAPHCAPRRWTRASHWRADAGFSRRGRWSTIHPARRVSMTEPGSYSLKAIPGYHASKPGIQLGIQLAPDASPEDIRFARQLGVEWVMTSLPPGIEATPAAYRTVSDHFAAAALKVYRLANHSCHNMESVTLGLPYRDARIQSRLTYLRN